MTVVTLPPFTLLGLAVTATFDDLFHVVPEAWDRLRKLAHAPADTSFVEVSTSQGGLYFEILGFESAGGLLPGLERFEFPGGKYLHERHEGPVKDIFRTFGAMFEWGAEHGLVLGEGKIDRGYRFAEVEPHDLYVELRG